MFKKYESVLKSMLLLCCGVSACLPVVGCQHSETHHGIEIVGPEEFVSHVEEALRLVYDKAPEDLKLIAKYVKRIEHNERSGMDASRNVPTCQLAPATAYASLTWCAGCIAHEAHHSKLAHSESYVYGSEHEEKECIAYQLAVMERIGAPSGELEYLASQDGKHFDLDGDGEYTWSDYNMRTW